MIPSNAIVPLFALSETKSIQGFLGTAAFVVEKNRLLTAEHVVRGWKHDFGIIIHPDVSAVYEAVLIEADYDRDLALLETKNYESEFALELAESEGINTNAQVVTLEYGPTRTSGTLISISAATR